MMITNITAVEHSQGNKKEETNGFLLLIHLFTINYDSRTNRKPM